MVPMSVTNHNWVKRVVYAIRPDVIIYAAGSNSVDVAEAEARQAEAVHTAGPATIMNAAEIFQPRVIYLSNPNVFDGQRGNYKETDVVLPFTNLGKSKVGGENTIRSRALNYVVLRSSMLMGRGNGHHISFLDQLRMALDRGEPVKMPTHELHSFAPVNGLVDVVEKLIEGGPKNRILHYGGLTKINTLEFCKWFAKRFGYDEKLVTESQQSIGKTTDDFSLNSSLAVETLKIKPLLLEEGFDLIEKELIVRA